MARGEGIVTTQVGLSCLRQPPLPSHLLPDHPPVRVVDVVHLVKDDPLHITDHICTLQVRGGGGCVQSREAEAEAGGGQGGEGFQIMKAGGEKCNPEALPPPPPCTALIGGSPWS